MDNIIDVRTLKCPEPMMLIRSKVRKMQDGHELEVHCDDPRTPSDIRKYCVMMNHTLLSEEKQKDDHGEYHVAILRKGK